MRSSRWLFFAATALGWWSGGALCEDAQPVAKAEDAIYVLTLDKAVEGGRTLEIYLDVKDGAPRHTFALAPKFNAVSHEADASGLKLEAGKLSGQLKVTVHPDAWVPKDHKSFTCEYTLDAIVKAPEVSGTFKGTFGGKEVSGQLKGALQARAPLPAPAKVELVLENAVNQGQGKDAWMNRSTFSFVLKEGKVEAAKFGPSAGAGRNEWTAKVKSAEAKLDETSLSAVASVEVGGATLVFSLEAKVVGRLVAGGFTSKSGEKEGKKDRLQGKVKVAP